MSTGCYSQILITGRVYKTMFGVIKPFDSREQKSLCEILHLTGSIKTPVFYCLRTYGLLTAGGNAEFLTENNNGIINGYRILILANV